MKTVKAYVKARTTAALRSALRHVAWEYRMCRRQQSALKKVPQFLGASPLKLNLGCGPQRKPGWVNIDLFDEGADLQLDLREPWPFPDGSVSYIYSEHVFEHLDFLEEVPHFLSESRRVLQTAGEFDVGVPDTEWPLRAWGNPDDEYWRLAKSLHPAWCETRLDSVNFHFRQDKLHGEHKYAWDEETLVRTLKKAGFTSVVRRPFDPSLDSEARRTGTLYLRAMAEKPGRSASSL
jgi:predicted SAM-dependent methyltransferase